MPSKSAKQAKFMRAIAAGWKPDRMKNPPSRAVAREFVEADKAKGMYEGGMAPMNDIIQRGMAPELGGLSQAFQEGGEVEGRTFKQLIKDLGGGVPAAIRIARGLEEGKYWKSPDGLIYPAQQTILGEQGEGTIPRTPGYDPYYGRGPDTTTGGGTGIRRPAGGRRALPQYDEYYGGVAPGTGGPRGGRGRQFRDRNGEDGPPGPGPGEPPPPRVIPPGRPPGGGLVPPTDIPPDWVPPDPRAGRDTEYSRALREHRARVAATLMGVPAGGYAGGGAVNEIPASREVGYAEGGTARADNPYPVGSARWKVWERKHGRDPNAPEPEAAPPPPPAAEEEDDGPSWLDRLRGVESERRGRTEEELEELGEGRARGGYIPASREVGYQMGGLAAAMRGPRGGLPPQVSGGMMRPRMGGVPPRMDPRAMPPVSRSMPIKPMPGGRMMVPPSAPPGGASDMPGPRGGPMVPPSLRGELQRMRMMNRPRRGIPGPAGGGGAPNRVGQSDQQGGLARALQRGTGRPPMSRRQGFYR